MTTSGDDAFAWTRFPSRTRRLPVRPAMGARMLVLLTLNSALATAAASAATVANALFNVNNTSIRAPIAGRTGSLLVREGNLVHANASSPLVVINQISPILVRFSVPASQLPLIQRF